MPPAKAGRVTAGDPLDNVKPFATASFMKHDFSLKAYKKSQIALANRPKDFESTVFHVLDVTCPAGRFITVVGVELEFLPTSASNGAYLSCSLYELQNGRWLMTSTRQHSALFALPWKHLDQIKAIVFTGVASMNEFGTWQVVE